MRPPRGPLVRVLPALALALAMSGCADDEAGATDETATEEPSASTTPPAVLEHDEAARAFFDAVVAGDRSAAETVATPDAVSFFDPFDPAPDYTFSMSDSDGIFFISPGAAPFQCTVADGLVQECLDEPTGEADLTDGEAARAFFDAVVAGDRDAAAAVATEQAVEYFDPYGPTSDYTYFPPDDDGLFFISPGAAPFQCTVTDGLVQECVDETLAPEQR